jgi:hypothetical protein
VLTCDHLKVRQGLWLSTIWIRRGVLRSRLRCRMGYIAMSSVEMLVVLIQEGGVQGYRKFLPPSIISLYAFYSISFANKGIGV